MKKRRMQCLISLLLAVVLCGCADSTGAQTTVGAVETQGREQAMAAGIQGSNASDSVPMEVHFLDVGQGDATLVINGAHAMLIDAGDNAKGTAVQLYLQKRGIEHLDYLVLTHTDADHIGGADVVLTKFEVDTVFMGDYAKETATYRDVIQALDNKGLDWSTPEAGSVYELGDASFTIVAPNAGYSDANNTSIGLLLEKGENSFLFTGDAEEEAEEDIVQNGLTLQADVYQVGHHGSRTSTTQELLDAVNPLYAVISCAEGNDYGHPHAQTLNRLRERGIQVFRTDEQGSIIATADAGGITWNCAPSESWIAGEPKGSAVTETVSVQQTGERRSADNEIPAGESQSAANGIPAGDDQGNGAQPESSQEMPSAAASDTVHAGYICNTGTMKFHIPSCSSVSQMADKNKLESNAAREELVAQGYEPCKRCSP